MLLKASMILGMLSLFTAFKSKLLFNQHFRFSKRNFVMSFGKSTCKDRLPIVKSFQQKLSSQGVDAFIIPTDDPHLSEYTAAHYNRREFISGFTGSAGTALITRDKSLLFTDGRYHSQAELELDSTWTLMKQGLKDVPTLSEYLSETLPSGSVVAVDPFVHSAADFKKLSEALFPKNIKLITLTENPIDAVWGNRPPAPQGLLRVHDIAYAGVTVSDKLKELRKKLQEKKVSGIVSASLDEIAWLYNIRGADVPCNPVSVSYSLVTMDAAFLFIDSKKVPSDVLKHLTKAGVTVRPYEDALPVIQEMVKSQGKKIWIDSKRVNQAIFSLTNASTVFEADSPLILMKAYKNEAELRGMKEAHIRDGAAMAEFLSWLEVELKRRREAAGPTARAGLTEVEIDEHLTEFRKSYGHFLDLSFPTIAGVGSNGAIIHYRAVPESCKTLSDNDILLLDSGGQYTDGTTDVTRTFHTGTPSAYQKEIFTRVLKGHIGIDRQVFPVGTQGCLIDSFAREHLWAIGKDFLHGVGHGVGAALNVHEGPHSISRALIAQPLLPGVKFSI